MAINPNMIIKVELTDSEILKCIENATTLYKTMQDRPDLHPRGRIERYIDILMGEVAERTVIDWLISKGKFAESAVDKKSGEPDNGHDINLKHKDGKNVKCSVKSSLSVCKSDMDKILNTFHAAFKATEVKSVNVQVYYWLITKGGKGESRTTVPSEDNMAIIGWVGKNDLEGKKFKKYETKGRQVTSLSLKDMRPMEELLKFLK